MDLGEVPHNQFNITEEYKDMQAMETMTMKNANMELQAEAVQSTDANWGLLNDDLLTGETSTSSAPRKGRSLVSFAVPVTSGNDGKGRLGCCATCAGSQTWDLTERPSSDLLIRTCPDERCWQVFGLCWHSIDDGPIAPHLVADVGNWTPEPQALDGYYYLVPAFTSEGKGILLLIDTSDARTSAAAKALRGGWGRIHHANESAYAEMTPFRLWEPDWSNVDYEAVLKAAFGDRIM
jgi:hypothetical protein